MSVRCTAVRPLSGAAFQVSVPDNTASSTEGGREGATGGGGGGGGGGERERERERERVRGELMPFSKQRAKREGGR